MHADCTFVPQRTYMTLGTLRAQLCYPLSESESKAKFSDQDLRDALIKLNLKEVAETSSKFQIDRKNCFQISKILISYLLYDIIIIILMRIRYAMPINLML
jgi:ABC-type uncharacterized transport system fused permease/ATPase subunit